MTRICDTFEDQLKTVLGSEGKLGLPNVRRIEDANKALLGIAGASKMQDRPYRMRIETFDPPKPSGQTHSVAWYPKVFTNSSGMGGAFDGTGIILTADGGGASAYSFAMCEHEWDESGANHSRGWHPKRCKKCGFDASIDSGD